MHPLSIFPQLFSYPFLAYFILRLAVVWSIVRIGIMRWKKPYKALAVLEMAAAVFVLLGLYTQPALVAVIVTLIAEHIIDRNSLSPDQRMILHITGIIALCLLFLGPGSFAFDLPL